VEVRRELIASGTCSAGHDWAIYVDPAGEWQVDGGSDQVTPDEDRQDRPRVTCGTALGISP